MKPYKFESFLKTTIWGGEQIAAFKGIDTDLHNVGESWEISDFPGQESVVATGEDKGLNLSALVEKYKEQLVGEKVYAKFGNHFPLLVKFIDSHQNLSVQVHPNDELAMKRHGCRGKSEMWYVIKAEPGARIYTGLCKEITPERYVQMVTTETVGGYSPIMVSSLHTNRIRAMSISCPQDAFTPSVLAISLPKYNRPATSPIASMTMAVVTPTAIPANSTSNRRRMPSTITFIPNIVAPTTAPFSMRHWCIAPISRSIVW